MLRDYQEKAIADVIEAWKEHRKVCLVMPTGSGKTRTAVDFAKRAGSSIMVVHRKELLDQTIEAYKGAGLDVGIIAAGRGFNPTKKHYVAMVQTLARRQQHFKNWDPGVIIVDEAHLALAASYDVIFDHYKNSKVLALTATPVRLDGRGLGNRVDKLVIGPTIPELVKQGYLADYIPYAAPEEFDLSGVKKQMGDFHVGALGQAVDKATYTGNAVAEYKKHLSGKQAIVFAATVEHGYSVAEAFNKAGIKAAMLEGKTSDEERGTIISLYKAGEIDVLVNVQLFVEGLDIPNCNGVIMLRPTQSLTRYMQSVGRGLRPKSDGSKLIILDHAGNIARHGFPDEDRVWTLADKKKRGGSEPAMGVKNCPKCFRVQRATERNCVECGYEFIVKSVEVTEKEGDLIKINRTQLKPLKKWGRLFWQEVRSAVNSPLPYKAKLGALRRIAERAGFKAGWGYIACKAFVEQGQQIPEEGYVQLRI